MSKITGEETGSSLVLRRIVRYIETEANPPV
jgi:hypothetical protein